MRCHPGGVIARTCYASRDEGFRTVRARHGPDTDGPYTAAPSGYSCTAGEIQESEPGHVQRPRQTFELVPCVSLALHRTVARALTGKGIDRGLLFVRSVQTRLEHARRHAASGPADSAASLRRLSSANHRRLLPRSS